MVPGFESGAFEQLENDFQEVELARSRRDLCASGCGVFSRSLRSSGSSHAVLSSHAQSPHPLSFSQVLQELVGDQSLERFRAEYDKLHKALKKSHESEKRLIKKCRELNQVRCATPLLGCRLRPHCTTAAAWQRLHVAACRPRCVGRASVSMVFVQAACRLRG